MELPGDALVNYIFPNNAQVWWSIMIVIYPYITGLIAGAFVVSALSHVFKIKEFEPIANFALISAFCFGLFAAMPLLVHLGQPQRAFEIYVTPHTTSAMSIFGYIYSGYLLLLMIEIWFIYRSYFIEQAKTATGIMKPVWTVLTLGVTEYHPDSARLDRKIVVVLAGVGIPWAFTLHGYVGFVFGSVKAIAWWATPLQPVIFLLSAIVSGMAMLVLMYAFIMWRRGQAYDLPMIKKFMAFLWGVFILDVVVEILEVVFTMYEKSWHWSQIEPLLTGPLQNSYIVGQLLILSGIPLVVLGYVVLSGIQGRAMLYLSVVASFMLVLQVLFMRFNVVVGGQLISKSERGFVDFEWELFGKEGIPTAVVLLGAPFVAYYVFSRFIPILPEAVVQTEPDSPT